MSNETKSGFEFKHVMREELRIIKSLRSDRPPENPDDSNPEITAFESAHAENLTGLAFSGGGIRSATFNLGVLQALTKGRQKTDKGEGRTGLLSRFDYLSTVSGGGYIGCWLSAWLHREAIEDNKKNPPLSEDALIRVDAKLVDKIQPKITTRPCSFGPEPKDTSGCIAQSGFAKPWTTGFPPLEHAAVRYLRRYSNYLTPRLGMSGDTLALISLFLRNLVLLQLALITLVAAILLIPYLIAAISASGLSSDPNMSALPMLMIILGVVLFLTALIMWRPQIRALFSEEKKNTDSSTVKENDSEPQSEKQRARERRSTWRMVFSVLLCTLAIWLIFVGSVPYFFEHGLVQKKFIIFGALGYLLAWLIGPGSVSFFRSGKEGHTNTDLLKHFIIAMLTGAIFGALIYFFAVGLEAETFAESGHMLAAISFIPPLILLIISFAIALHLGIARSLFDEQEREWWARLGGLVLFAAFAWALVFSIAYYSPSLLHWLGNGGIAVVVAWATGSGVGAWIARSASTSGASSGSIWKSILIKLAPWLFIGGLGLIISYGLFSLITINIDQDGLLEKLPRNLSLVSVIAATSPIIEGISVWYTLLAFAVVSVTFLFLTWRLDINAFSAHSLYRNRLVRAYLGASRGRKRKEHFFTGFDPADDMRLALLSQQRPIPILNTTINMTGGDDLAWQTRRAASFTFTPQFVGYEAKSSQGFDLGGYRQTWAFASERSVEIPKEILKNSENAGEEPVWYPKPSETRGLRLGTVLAISGAAASPNMGYNTSPSIAALLTAFNLRLGYWSGNPARKEISQKSGDPASRDMAPWQRKRARFCAKPIISELTGSANAESDWVNLTDGGHFDNLGIYELVRRRCRFIVVTDAGCDPEHQFQDLANTIRKCWTDLGVHISFLDLEDLSLNGKTKRHCLKHWSLGLMEYPDGANRSLQSYDYTNDRKRFGLILYLKCSLTISECNNYVDIRQYAAAHDQFPHESTADQFFDEDQFEAYRHLGFCAVESVIPTIENVFDPVSGLVDEDKVFDIAKDIYKKQLKRKRKKKRKKTP